MNEIPASKVAIQDRFWSPRLERNAEVTIFQQWEQLERTGCIENFRLVTGERQGFREGYFFADSDAYRWLDAASRIYASRPSSRLKELMDGLVKLLMRAQEHDGYLYTYNQFHFPGVRWRNLQIEHELYCHGHLIEAGVSHFLATGDRTMLAVARRAADLLVREFSDADPRRTPGHEEIELALLRLYAVVQDRRYLDLSAHFIAQRGRTRLFFWQLLKEYFSYLRRDGRVKKERKRYISAHPEYQLSFQLPEENVVRKPWYGAFRWYWDTLSGKYFQQHKPVEQQTRAEGHAVRFLYLETAIAMLQRLKGDPKPMAPLNEAWENMVARRMYITGGLGAQPTTEGFGRDYELDPRYAYAETCAAVGSIFWNWEMTLTTGNARYADLIEWQLYNAALVGVGEDGVSYFYNNPLSSDGYLSRRPWYRCPCCPSNFSRMLADLGRYVYGWDEGKVWIHQYVGSETEIPGIGKIEIVSRLPWEGSTTITLSPPTPREFTLNLRLPSWSEGAQIFVNGESVMRADLSQIPGDPTAIGYDPRRSRYISLRRRWRPQDVVEVFFSMKIHMRATHPRVKATRGKVALTRGPLVYCLESVDNPGVDIFSVRLDPESPRAEASKEHFGGAVVLRARTVEDRHLTFIPYFLWANRGPSQMSVYVRV